jgi:hypothetical protein
MFSKPLDQGPADLAAGTRDQKFKGHRD